MTLTLTEQERLLSDRNFRRKVELAAMVQARFVYAHEASSEAMKAFALKLINQGLGEKMLYPYVAYFLSVFNATPQFEEGSGHLIDNLLLEGAAAERVFSDFAEGFETFGRGPGRTTTAAPR